MASDKDQTTKDAGRLYWISKEHSAPFAGPDGKPVKYGDPVPAKIAGANLERFKKLGHVGALLEPVKVKSLEDNETKVKSLQAENKSLKAANDKLQAEAESLKAANVKLVAEKKAAQDYSAELQAALDSATKPGDGK